MNSTTFYCAASFSRSDDQGQLLSLALLSPEGEWFYAEVVDFDITSLDDHAQRSVLPVLMKVPGTRFVHSADELIEAMAVFLAGFAHGGLKFVHSDSRGLSASTAEVLRRATTYFQADLVINECRVDPALSEEFFDRCGGSDRVLGNAYIHALHIAICDVDRAGASHIAELPLNLIEMLMGSKNAVSYRAWARGLERHRADAQTDRLRSQTPAFAQASASI